ncbi:MAG: hypothetical protein KBA53_04835 [Thermoclostridium sp.]|nr:hypothetical protein [Thermoclostridium sp.]
MKKNLIFAIIAPCILAVVLIIIISIDSRNDKKPLPPNNGTEVVAVVTPTREPEPTILAEQTPVQITPTQRPTEAPTKAPTVTPTQSPTSTPTPTPAAESTVTPSPTPLQEVTGDITDTPQNPDETINIADPGTSLVTDITDNSGTYIALYTQQGEEYTLIADSISGAWLFLKNSDNSLRQTEFNYAKEYEEVGRWDYGPVLAYKNNTFFFMAGDQLIASDGHAETVLYSFGDRYQEGFELLNAFAQSENRFMIGSNRTLVVVDSRTLAVEAYTHEYTNNQFALSDEVLCFSVQRRIPAGPYFNIMYSAKAGNIKQLGMIGEIEAYVLEGDIITIKSNAEMFEINLATEVLTGPRDLEQEYTLHMPVYSSGYVGGLSEIRYINYNEADKPVQSIQLPGSWETKCNYFTYYSIPYLYSFSDKEKERLLPGKFGEFLVADTSSYPLEQSKYLSHSTVKEQLFSGRTLLGEGEIFLLERYERNASNEEILYEIIYAWVPIQGKSQAYQFYVYVPSGEAYQDYLTLMKHLIKAE